MQTIEISTTQNVSIEYELAGLRERFFAILIDTLIMIFIGIAFRILFSFFDTYDSRFLQIILGLFPIWFTILYSIMCEAFLNGQTLGKRVQKIKVVRVDGKPINLSDLLLRAVLLIPDYFFTLGIMGALLISSTDKRQRLGDMAAGTTVIKMGTDRRFQLYDILNINTLENYTPQYPQVRQLSEDDMLFIKNLIIRFQKFHNGSHEDAVEELYLHLTQLLDIRVKAESIQEKLSFFKILIKDFIVLTR
jgi:uncharacterized RDD family membrane protein YckC